MDKDWDTPWVRCVGVLLNGEELEEYDDDGKRVQDDTLLLILNSYGDKLSFVLPAYQQRIRWETIVNTAFDFAALKRVTNEGGAHLQVPARSLLLLRRLAD
jgi:isoamylase